MTHASRLEDRHYDAGARHDENDHRVVIIIVRDPQANAKQLEDVERIKHFEAEQREYALHGNHDLVVTVNASPADINDPN